MATFVLVHGAEHGGWCWRRVVPLLRAASHEVFAPTLTGLGERAHLAHPGIDLDTHIHDVLGVLAYEDLDRVVLVGHSYGATVVAGVADRAPGRIAHLVYLDGGVAGDGQAVLDLFPPDGQAALRARVEAAGDGWRLPPADPSAFGVTDPEDALWVRAKLVPQPFKTFTQPLRLANPAGFTGPRTYIACVAAAPAGWRDAMVERARVEPGWHYRELATGHDAMITAPRRAVDLLLEAAHPASSCEAQIKGDRGVTAVRGDVKCATPDCKIVRICTRPCLWGAVGRAAPLSGAAHPSLGGRGSHTGVSANPTTEHGMLSARGSGGSGTIPSVAATSGMDDSFANRAPVPAAGADRQEDRAMPKYGVLVNWTEQGAQSVTETTQRAEHVQQMVEQMGGRMGTLLWTQGRYDLVGVMEVPDEETAAAVGLRVGMRGAVRTETLRAYDAEEMGRILTKSSYQNR